MVKAYKSLLCLLKGQGILMVGMVTMEEAGEGVLCLAPCCSVSPALPETGLMAFPSADQENLTVQTPGETAQENCLTVTFSSAFFFQFSDEQLLA